MSKDYLVRRLLSGASDEELVEFITSDKCTEGMLEYCDYGKNSALTYAADFHRFKVVEALLSKDADVNHVAGNGFNALMTCIRKQVYSSREEDAQLKTIELLIDANANLNYEGRDSAFTLACLNNHNHIIQKLLQYEINIDFLDEDGNKGIDYLIVSENQVGISLVNSYLLNKQLQQELNTFEEQKKKPKI